MEWDAPVTHESAFHTESLCQTLSSPGCVKSLPTSDSLLSLSFVSVRLSFSHPFFFASTGNTKIMHIRRIKQRPSRGGKREVCWIVGGEISWAVQGAASCWGKRRERNMKRADQSKEKGSGIQHGRCNGYCITLWRDVKLIAIFFKASRPFIDFLSLRSRLTLQQSINCLKT